MELLIDHVSKCFKDKKAVNNISLALLLFILLAYLPTTYCYSNYTDEAGNKANLTGLASITCEKERQADNVGIVTPERVRKAVEIYQESCKQKSSPKMKKIEGLKKGHNKPSLQKKIFLQAMQAEDFRAV